MFSNLPSSIIILADNIKEFKSALKIIFTLITSTM